MNRFILIFILTVFALTSIKGQSLFSAALSDQDSLPSQTNNISGFSRTAFYSPIHNGEINSLYSQAGLLYEFSKDKIQLKSDIRFKAGKIFQESISEFDLRECLMSYTGERLSMNIGQQIITWGTTEGFNPTNNISPVDFFSLADDPIERDIPNFMLDGHIDLSSQIAFQWILIPVFKSSLYRFDLIRQENNLHYSDVRSPAIKLKNCSFALKLQGHFPSLSMSLSLFNGYDPLLSLDIDQIELNTDQIPQINFYPKPYRKSCIGSDFEIMVGTWIMRGELALNLNQQEEESLYTPEDHLKYVFNLEYNLLSTTVIMQYIGMHVLDFEGLMPPQYPDQPDPESLLIYQTKFIEYETKRFNQKIFNLEHAWNHACSIHLFKSFNYELIETQFNAYYSISTKEWMIFPKVSWKITDHLKLSTGYQYLDGEDESLFSYTSPKLSNFFLELVCRF